MAALTSRNMRCLLGLRLAGSEPELEPRRACRTTSLEALGVHLASSTESRRLSTSAWDLYTPQVAGPAAYFSSLPLVALERGPSNPL